MFGYVIPNRLELKVREDKLYKSVYCGLCHTLGRRYGFRARFLLNYDFTFLAMLLDAGETPCVCCQKHCPIHPIRKDEVQVESSGLDAAADATIILSWWKAQDGAQDDGLRGKITCRLFSFVFRRQYRAAKERAPDFDRTVQERLFQLRQLEIAQSDCLDAAADTFANLLSAAAGQVSQPKARILSQLLYHVGRWVYLVDAWDDLKDDFDTGSYNPIRFRFALDRPELTPEARERLQTTMLHSRSIALSALNLLPESSCVPILENVLIQGMPMVEGAVSTGLWHSRKKQRHQLPVLQEEQSLQETN